VQHIKDDHSWTHDNGVSHHPGVFQLGRKICIVFSFVLLVMGTPFARAQDQPDVRLEKGTFIARGKWNPTDTKPREDFAHLPIVEVHCFKEQSYCMQAIASVRNGAPSLAVQYYKVIHWDKNNIVAENYDFSCTTNQLKVDIKESMVLAVDSPKKKGTAVKGKASTSPCDQLEHAITYKLIGEDSDKTAQQADVSTPAQ
jgi:hypothetical protein